MEVSHRILQNLAIGLCGEKQHWEQMPGVSKTDKVLEKAAIGDGCTSVHTHSELVHSTGMIS